MAVNEARGEVELEIGQSVLVLRPTYKAQQLIEDELGERMVPLAQRIAAGDVGVRDIVTIISFSMLKNGHDWTEEQIGDAVIQGGLDNAIGPVLAFLSNAIRGWPDEKKSPTPEQEKPDKSPPSDP